MIVSPLAAYRQDLFTKLNPVKSNLVCEKPNLAVYIFNELSDENVQAINQYFDNFFHDNHDTLISFYRQDMEISYISDVSVVEYIGFKWLGLMSITENYTVNHFAIILA